LQHQAKDNQMKNTFKENKEVTLHQNIDLKYKMGDGERLRNLPSPR
jgi:hypothetical protein